MKKILLLAIIVMAFAFSASAQVPAKPFNIYASAGLTLPSGDASDFYKSGFHGNAQLGFNSFPKGEILINLGYHKLSSDYEGVEGGDLSAILAGADLKLNLGVPAAPISPFVFAGAGISTLSWSDETETIGTVTTTYTYDSENKFYFEVGGGVQFSQFFVKVRYVNISIDDMTLAMLPLSVGVKF
ncbi:MAG: hypothetical protein DWP97_09530 [Calditrichaeota bacterium]|nr:MAG: hypothetical protein DWP97_09530 [Calditrichota bacterium]